MHCLYDIRSLVGPGIRELLGTAQSCSELLGAWGQTVNWTEGLVCGVCKARCYTVTDGVGDGGGGAMGGSRG